MTLPETPMTYRYWRRVGGFLPEDYLIVPPGPGADWRWAGSSILGGRHGNVLAAGKASGITGLALLTIAVCLAAMCLGRLTQIGLSQLVSAAHVAVYADD